MKKLFLCFCIIFFCFFNTPISAECKSIADYGAIGDGITDDAEAFQTALKETGVLNLEQGKTYRLTKGLLIPSKTIINGNNSTIIIDDINFFMDESNPKENNGKGLFFYQFFFPTNYSTTSELLEINNLNITWNVSKALTHVNTYYLFIINDIETARFNSLSITIGGYSNNSIQPFKFNSQAKAVKFDKCSIYNYAHGNDGSCIWFHANGTNGYPNVSITNSYFYSEAHDELISAWGPYQKNITVSDCTFLRHCVPCVGSDRKTVTSNNICLVSKSTTDLSDNYQSEYANTSSIKYNNCNFDITYESEKTKPYYFIATSSYYNAPIKTYFTNCNISGSFAKGFISGEAAPSDSYNNSNIEYHKNIGIFFYDCNLAISAPTLLTTRSANTVFENCTISTDNVLMDTLYVDTNLIACSYYYFTNNNVLISSVSSTIFKDLNIQHSNQLYVQNNTFFCPLVENIELYTLTNKDCSSYTKTHSLGAKSMLYFNDNTILTQKNTFYKR